MQPNDSAELHNLPLVIKVRLKRRDDTDELTNEIKGYVQPETNHTSAQKQSLNNNNPPWKR